MYSILVVDDEPRHRMGLLNMIRRLKPEYMVSEARNGEEALMYIKNNPVNIVITDIKMPVIDGLQLIEQLGDRIKEIKVIILSAFGYFEYAQKAVSLGAFDYLLKPVDEEKILELLKKLEIQIKNEQTVQQERESLRKQLNNTLPVYLELQMNKWVKGNLSEFELKEIESIFPFKGAGIVLASEITNFKSYTEKYNRTEINEIQSNIKYWMKEALNSIGHSISFYLHCDKTILITILNTSDKFNLLFQETGPKLDEFIKNIKIGYGFETIIGLSNSFDNIFDEVRKAFEQAVSAVEFSFFMEEKNIIVFSELTYKPNKVIITRYKEEEDLIEAICKIDRDKSIRIIDNLLKRMADGYPTVRQFLDNVNHILINVAKNIQNLIGEVKYGELVYRIPGLINESADFMSLKASVDQLIILIIEDIVAYRDRRGYVLFEKCMEYIQNHLAEDISLETVAEEFHFNQSYFSYIFKSMTGDNFSHYLNVVRLKKGRKLLEKTQKKVYEVAQEAGYKDPKYFIRVFKKEFGVTPDEYRRQI